MSNGVKCQNTKIADEPLLGLFCEDREGVNQYSSPILSLKQKNFQIRGNPFYGGGKKYKNARKKYKNTRKKYKNTRKKYKNTRKKYKNTRKRTTQ